MINARISKVVSNIKGPIKFLQPMFEAISNSLEANAKEIVIDLYSDNTISLDDTKPRLNGYSIVDDGEGFTTTNINSFNELWSDLKAKQGCKGSGRFTWLKVFKSINIESYTFEDGGTLVRIPFDLNYDKTVEKESIKVDKTSTKITFSNVTDSVYSNGAKKQDNREFADLPRVRQEIITYFQIKFYLLKKEGRTFHIQIRLGEAVSDITEFDIPEMESYDFYIKDEYSLQQYKFSVYHSFHEDKKGQQKVYLCSSNRSVDNISNGDVGLRGNLPNNDSINVWVVSNYFNDKDSDSRTGLKNVLSGNKSIDLPIDYHDIVLEVKQIIRVIIHERYPKLSIEQREIVDELKNQYPYLAKYLSNVDIVTDEEKLLKEANKEFNDQKIIVKNKFVENLKAKNLDSESFHKAVQNISLMAAAELSEYIIYRSNIISALEKAGISPETKEKTIHNLFMPMGTASDNKDYLLSNFWLLDDKFMTFSRASSDQCFNRIQKTIQGQKDQQKGGDRRPDSVLMFFSNDPMDSQTSFDALIIEFKGPNADEDEKAKSIIEIKRNAKILKEKFPNLRFASCYIITSIDENFSENLTLEEFIKAEELGNDKGTLYYNISKTMPYASFFALDIEKIVDDSRRRNQTFLSILSKN